MIESELESKHVSPTEEMKEAIEHSDDVEKLTDARYEGDQPFHGHDDGDLDKAMYMDSGDKSVEDDGGDTSIETNMEDKPVNDDITAVKHPESVSGDKEMEGDSGDKVVDVIMDDTPSNNEIDQTSFDNDNCDEATEKDVDKQLDVDDGDK